MVTVLFHAESHFPVDKQLIERAITENLSSRVTSDVEVSVTIVGDRRMKQLNREYREKDKTTDVLSFPQHDPTQPSQHPFVTPPDNVLRLGDIIVSYPQAVLAAAEEHKLVDDKVCQLILHGLDHLMGIHHD